MKRGFKAAGWYMLSTTIMLGILVYCVAEEGWQILRKKRKQ